MSLKRLVVVIVLVFAMGNIFVPRPVEAQVLTREPPIGAMKEGERVLVDDGTCPKGQIKEVIGGNHVKVGGTKQVERQRRCITPT